MFGNKQLNPAQIETRNKVRRLIRNPDKIDVRTFATMSRVAFESMRMLDVNSQHMKIMRNIVRAYSLIDGPELSSLIKKKTGDPELNNFFRYIEEGNYTEYNSMLYVMYLLKSDEGKDLGDWAELFEQVVEYGVMSGRMKGILGNMFSRPNGLFTAGCLIWVLGGQATIFSGLSADRDHDGIYNDPADFTGYLSTLI